MLADVYLSPFVPVFLKQRDNTLGLEDRGYDEVHWRRAGVPYLESGKLLGL